jgi:AsmA protein
MAGNGKDTRQTMMVSKLVRGVAWGTGAVVALIAVAVLAIVVFIDPNDYRDDITQAVQKATGRELKLPGEIQLSVFPWLGVSLGAAQLSNARGFGEAEFARVEAVDIKVKLLPLLQQRIEMKTLDLRGLQVNLSRAADGRTNWDDLIAAPAKTTKGPVVSPEAAPKKSPAAPLAALAIGGVNIEDAHIRWDDRQAGQHIEIEKLSLRTGPIAPRAPIDIQLATQLSLSDPELQTPVKLQGRLSFDLATQRYVFDRLDLALNLSSSLLPVSPMSVHLTGNIDADLAQQQVQVEDVILQALNLTVIAKLKLTQILTAPQAEGEISVASFSPRDLMKTLGVVVPETADSKALNKAKLALRFSGSTEALSVNKLEAMWDDSRLTGTLQVKNFSKPAVRFDFGLDAIDVDRYLPPPPPGATPAPPSPAGIAVASTQLPLELLRGLDINGNFLINKMQLVNAHVSELQLALKAQGGQLRLHPLKAHLYDGQYEGDIAVDVRKDIPQVAVNESVSNIKVGPLLQDVLGEDKVSGLASVSTKLTASGVELDAIKKSLNGTAQFHFENGAVKGVNLGQMIREAYAKIKNKPKPPKQENQTDFAELSGSVTIHNGVASNDDLQAKSPLLRVTGKGEVDLPRERIDYRVNASIVETDQGQAGKELTELKSLTIPIKIGGSFAKPTFALDLAPVLKAKAKEELARQKTKVKEKVEKKLDEKKAKAKDRLEEQLKNKLKKLF